MMFLDTSGLLCLIHTREPQHQGGVTEALTSDHHFEQAGLRALLR